MLNSKASRWRQCSQTFGLTPETKHTGLKLSLRGNQFITGVRNRGLHSRSCQFLFFSRGTFPLSDEWPISTVLLDAREYGSLTLEVDRSIRGRTSPLHFLCNPTRERLLYLFVSRIKFFSRWVDSVDCGLVVAPSIPLCHFPER